MGKIIAIEGIDGSGKNTQSNNILKAYQTQGLKVSKMSFPAYEKTFFGKEVGHYLNGRFGGIDDVHPKLSAMLYAGDRFECKPELQRKLADGEVVILDRYVHSNVGYQTAKLPVEERAELRRWIEQLEYDVYGLPKPDVVIFLDVPPATSAELVLKKEARSYTDKKKDLHEENDSYLAKVYSVFKEIAASDDRWVTINCFTDGQLRTQEDIFQNIQNVLRDQQLLG